MNLNFKSLLYTFTLCAFTQMYTVYAACGSLSGDDPPGIEDITCIFQRLAALLVGAAGLIMVAMIAYGAIKLAMSFGDPKGVAGAKNTFTYIAIGTSVIILYFVIFVIMAHFLGLPSGLFGGANLIFADITRAILDLKTFIGI